MTSLDYTLRHEYSCYTSDSEDFVTGTPRPPHDTLTETIQQSLLPVSAQETLSHPLDPLSSQHVRASMLAKESSEEDILLYFVSLHAATLVCLPKSTSRSAAVILYSNQSPFMLPASGRV